MAMNREATSASSRRRWVILGLMVLIGLMLWALPGRMSLWVGQNALGAELGTTGDEPATVAAFAGIPGVTQQYVDAYNLFVEGQRADNPEHDYDRSIAAFAEIAATSDNPELRLRSAYFLTLCHFLEGNWSEAYEWAENVLSQARELHSDDPRTQLALDLAERARAGEVTLSDVRTVLAAQLGVDESVTAGELSDRYGEGRRDPDRSPSWR